MPAPPPERRNAPPSCVMLLSLWAPPAAPWHARLVGADAQTLEFDSPFELARYVAQLSSRDVSTERDGPPGLR